MERSSVSARMTYPQLLKILVFVGGGLLVIGVFIFTHQLIGRLSREVATTSRVLARFCAQASFPATTDPQMRQIFSEVIATIDFPIVITDEKGIPRAWREVDVDPALVPAASIDSLTLGLPIAPVIRARIERVQGRLAELDRKNAPIPMNVEGVNLGAVHYGEPPVLQRLRWMPFISFGGVALMLAIGLWGLTILRQAEHRMIWVGMAKETAHQLGTPLSSLMGWVELLKGSAGYAGSEPGVRAAELSEAVTEMERDLERLSKVAQRFSHVGSAPRLEPRDVTPMVRDVVHYMRRRSPRGSGQVVFRERYEPVPEVRLNGALIEWALENLIANALSALDKRPATIEVAVATRKDGGAVEVVVSDNGRGMTPAQQRRAFEPGYTTRRRGWGLGLVLARRVVEDYHGGRLFIRSSVPGQGTTVVVSLPVAREATRSKAVEFGAEGLETE